jgi:hypothetical protein
MHALARAKPRTQFSAACVRKLLLLPEARSYDRSALLLAAKCVSTAASCAHKFFDTNSNRANSATDIKWRSSALVIQTFPRITHASAMKRAMRTPSGAVLKKHGPASSISTVRSIVERLGIGLSTGKARREKFKSWTSSNFRRQKPSVRYSEWRKCFGTLTASRLCDAARQTAHTASVGVYDVHVNDNIANDDNVYDANFKGEQFYAVDR